MYFQVYQMCQDNLIYFIDGKSRGNHSLEFSHDLLCSNYMCPPIIMELREEILGLSCYLNLYKEKKIGKTVGL